jgi:hypothetical protein
MPRDKSVFAKAPEPTSCFEKSSGTESAGTDPALPKAPEPTPRFLELLFLEIFPFRNLLNSDTIHNHRMIHQIENRIG